MLSLLADKVPMEDDIISQLEIGSRELPESV
jgi:hypothetical protein